MEDLFNFIITLYIGFLIVYVTHPVPKILYKKIYLNNCKESEDELCVATNHKNT